MNLILAWLNFKDFNLNVGKIFNKLYSLLNRMPKITQTNKRLSQSTY